MITLVPVGGLANRMRAIDSALALAEELNTPLHVIWYKDSGLNCPFHELFQPINHPLCTLREAACADLFLYDRPRRKNFHIPRLFQYLRFDKELYEEEVTKLYYQHFDFVTWCRNKNVYIASCVHFHPRKQGKSFEVFKPIDSLLETVDNITRSFHCPTYGIHIRRTDNIVSITESPTDLFIQRIKKEMALQPDVQFYLASDSEEDKKNIRSIFGQRILTAPYMAVRNTIKGMKEALIEMYVLSRTQRIMGSVKSSYSETAAQIGDIPCEIIQRAK